MPWQNQGGGGPWGSGNGGNRGGGNSPWGRGGGSGGQKPPNFDDLFRQGQERLKRMFPGGPGGSRLPLYIILGVFILWLLSGIYVVKPDEQGVVQTFGAWKGETTEPGLNYHWPAPIQSVETPRVEQINSIEVGFRSLADSSRGPKRDVPEESLMLTSDQNIIDVDFAVQWKIKNAGEYLFNVRDPQQTVKTAAEAAMREVIGHTGIQPALTEARGKIEIDTRSLLQAILDAYGAGIEIRQVQLLEVHPPQPVIDAFNDVQRSLQDRDRAQNEADAYRNDIIPRARGEAVKAVQDANAYRERVINEAQGRAQRFTSVYNEYKNAKDVTAKRMYYDTMEAILKDAKKYVVTGSGGTAPYMPLPLPSGAQAAPEPAKKP
jgi:membrane protease subunit HflK